MSEYSIVIDYLDRSININRMCTETDFSSNTDAIKLDTAQFYNFLFYFTMLLNTKSVKCEEVEIPDKLQKARERKGKPKLSNYILVSNPTVVRNSSGTHASPRPHWRRGHVRHWGEKRIPIPPVIVNAAKRTGLVEHRTYIVDRNDPDAARI